MASVDIVDGIDPSALRLFLAVVELGSVSRAATRMRVTQPSATAKLKKLERQLGSALLERTPTGSVPTEAGRRLAPACIDALAAVTSLVDQAETVRSEADRLTIASTRHVGDHFLPQWLSHVPGVRVDVEEHDTLRVAQAVRSGDAMLGFIEGPAAPIGLRSRIVAGERVLAVVGRGHPWHGRRTTVTADEVAGTTVIVTRPGSGTRDVVEAAFAPHDWGNDTIQVSNSSAARLAALTGTAVAFLPECWVRPLLGSGDLAVLPVREPIIELPIRVAWRGNTPANPAARRLLAALT